MNFRVWKYDMSAAVKSPRGIRDEIHIMMPFEAQLLDARYEDKFMMLWAQHLIENEKNLVTRRFRVILTNEEMDLEYLWKHFKTIVSPTMQNAYHIYQHHG